MAGAFKDMARAAGLDEVVDGAEAAAAGVGGMTDCCATCSLGGMCIGPECFSNAAACMDLASPYAELLGKVVGCLSGPCVFPIVYCFDGTDESGRKPWDVSMEAAPMKHPCVCCMNLCCTPCVQYGVRYRVLGNDMTKYICCQGRSDGPYCCATCSSSLPFIFTAGSYGERDCPWLCLACEVTCCPFCAFHASREVQRDERGLGYDPTEIRVDKCLDFFGTIAHCLCCTGCCLKCVGCCAGCCLGQGDFDESSQRLGNACLHIAHGIYKGMRYVILIATSCMSAQMIHEASLAMPSSVEGAQKYGLSKEQPPPQFFISG